MFDQIVTWVIDNYLVMFGVSFLLYMMLNWIELAMSGEKGDGARERVVINTILSLFGAAFWPISLPTVTAITALVLFQTSAECAGDWWRDRND
jgi:hypothetical protein